MTDAERAKRIAIAFEAQAEAFERAIEERFKPALAKAIVDVASEFVESVAGEIALIKGDPA
jgi:hypothetical protein